MGVGLYVIGRRLMPDALAMWAALPAFVYPPLVALVFNDPYENAFAPAATVWLAAAVIARRWRAAAILVCLVLGIKEDQALILGCNTLLFAWYARRAQDRAAFRFAAGTALAAVLVVALYFGVILPHGAWSGLATAITPARGDGIDPIGRLGYLVEVFLPVCGAPFFAPDALALAIVPLAEVALAPLHNVWNMGEHYSGVWIGWVLVAAVAGVARYARDHAVRALRLARASLVVCVLILAFASPTHWRYSFGWPSAADAKRDRFLATAVPSTVPVGFDDGFYAHAWDRPTAEHGLRAHPCFAVIDLVRIENPAAVGWLPASQLYAAVLREHYVVATMRDGLALYRRPDCPAISPER